MEKLLEGEKALSSSQLYRVHFEELVMAPEATVEKLCDWLEIPFTKEMLSGREFKVPVYTRQQHALVGKSVDPTACERWRKVFRPWEIKLIEDGCSDLMESLGYQPEFRAVKPPFYAKTLLKFRSRRKRARQRKVKSQRASEVLRKEI